MTEQFSTKCTDCGRWLEVETPSDWKPEDIAAYTKDIPCCEHPQRDFEIWELPLNKELLAGTLDDPGNPKNPRLSVYKPKEGRHHAPNKTTLDEIHKALGTASNEKSREHAREKGWLE